MADLQRDDRDEGRTATSTGPHTTHDETRSEETRGEDTRGEARRETHGEDTRGETHRETHGETRGEAHEDRGSNRRSTDHNGSDRLLGREERSDLRERWDALQGRFVDDPSGSTHLADELLRDTRDRIARRWEERHRELTDRWEGRDDLTTEDLRTTLRRYRDAFEQLLSSS